MEFKEHVHFMAHSFESEIRIQPDILWKKLSMIFQRLSNESRVTLRAFILMGNHLHGIAECREESFSFERLIKKEFEELGIHSKYIQTVEITNFKQYSETYKYVYRNSVEAEICKRVEEFRHSTLKALFGEDREVWPVVDNMNLIQNPRHVLEWLNDEKPLFFQIRD